MRLAQEVWRDEGSGLALVSVRCAGCGLAYLPHVDVCPECLGDVFEEVLDTVGNLHSYTTVHVLPAGFPRPLTMGYVDLPSGARAFGHFPPGVESADLRTDMPVRFDSAELFVGDDGEPVVAYRFLPAAGGADA
jgi:uncharacterized OB-fold protein